jgi:hypothetical protein
MNRARTHISVYCIASLFALFPHCRWFESPCPGELPRIHQGFESICPVRCTAHPSRQCYPGGTREIPDAEELEETQTQPTEPREGSIGSRHRPTPAELARDARAD